MGADRAPVLQGVHVLVIEDVDDIRDVLALLLRAEGADVKAAGTGKEASELAAQFRFDVVLSDLGLPDIPGDMLIRQIRAGSTGPRVVAITGYGEPYVSRALQAGAEVVFTKPVEWSTILEHLRRPDLRPDLAASA